MIEKGYATEKDILKLVAEENNITLKQAEYVYKFMCAKILELARRDEVMAIRLPDIGTIYKNSYLIKKYLRETGEENLSIVRNAKESLEKIKSYREVDPDTGAVSRKGLAHRRKPFIQSRIFNKFKESVKDFEEFHNNNQ